MSSIANHDRCIFCNVEKERIIIENNFFIVARDKYPVSQGYTLIVPKRHVDSFFELSNEDFKELQPILKKAKTDLDSHFQPMLIILVSMMANQQGKPLIIYTFI